MKNYFLPLLLMACIFSCTEPDCIDLGGELIGISFRDEETGNLEPIRVNFLQVAGSTDTLIFEGENISQTVLPIDPAMDQISAYFDTELGSDTLVIGYNRTSRLIAEDCGTEIIYNNITIIRNDFDSARVINSRVALSFADSDVATENIQIFN